MEIRPVRRDEAAVLRELRLRVLGDAPHAYFASLESEERLSLSYWEDRATHLVSVRHLPAADAATLLDGFGLTTPAAAPVVAQVVPASAMGSSAALRVSPET